METKIIDYGMNGEGVAKLENGMTAFIPYTLKNEVVEYKIDKTKQKFCYCTADKIININKERVNAPCKYYTICGGCQLQHCNYKHSLEIKKNIVATNILKNSKINIFDELADIEIVESQPYNYRNKNVFIIKNNIIGMYKNSTTQLVPINNCMLANEQCNLILNITNSWLKNSFNNDLKYLVVRTINNQNLITIVTNNKINNIEELIKLLNSNNLNFGLFINKNTSNCQIISDNCKYIYGLRQISYTYNQINCEIDNQAFLQINNNVSSILYSDVCNICSGNIVANLYSGAGLLTAILAQKAKFVYGIEINRYAHNKAEKLRASNKINNISNILGDAKLKFTDISNKCDYVILDPPRSGCDKELLNIIIHSNIKQIIYISCNSSTLARDINYIKTHYHLSNIKLYDMFPNTSNIECLAVLTKKSQDQYTNNPI